MRGVILLNGERYCGKINTDDAFVVCCDGAVRWAEEAGIRFDLVVGDFDSLGYVPEKALVFPCEKDSTDGEIAMDELLKRDISVIEIYGGGGGREDHFFGNVALLVKAYEKGKKAVFATNYSEFYIIDGLERLTGCVGATISVFPLGGEIRFKKSHGVKYGMDGLVIRLGESRGISNVVLLDDAYIDVAEGFGLLFKIKKEI